VEKLPYEFDALEPFIDTHTLGLHYNKHYKNYLNNLNNLLMKNNYEYNYTLEDLNKHLNEFSKSDRENILFNLGGVINHNIYFKSMSPEKVIPSKKLNEKIINKYSSFDNLKKEFKAKALSLKGSGYTYLVIRDNELDIVNLFNQDNPYNHDLTPLLTLDMWEHAYYINYENKKDIYIDNFFDVLDFNYANQIVDKIKDI